MPACPSHPGSGRGLVLREVAQCKAPLESKLQGRFQVAGTRSDRLHTAGQALVLKMHFSS